MQALEEPKFIIDEFTDSNYSEWEKNFFSDDIDFSDSESDFTAQSFIKSSQNLQHTTTNSSPTEISSLCKIRSNHETDTTLLREGMLLSELNIVNQYDIHSIQNPSKNVVYLKYNNIVPNTKRKSNNDVHSEYFHIPVKKFKAEALHERKHLCSFNDFSNEGRECALKDIFKNKNAHFYKLEKCEGPQSVPTEETEKSPQDSVIISSNQAIFGSNQESSSSQMMTTSSQENSSSQKMTTSSQENSSSQKMTTSSQSSGSQRMTTSSQSSGSQRMMTSSQSSNSQRMTNSSQEKFCSQNMITSSQESSASQKMITSSQEYSNSQTMIPSSQESTYSQRLISSQEKLSVKVMNISIEEQLQKQTIIAQGNSVDEKLILNQEKDKNLKNSISNQQNSTKKLQVNEQQNLCSNTNPSKRVYLKLHKVFDAYSANKLKLSETVAGTGSAKKSDNQCIKEEKIRINWRIRKRELLITARENAVNIREKQLDEREADLLKRERILKAREKRYFKQRPAKMKGNMQKLINSFKEKRKFKQEKF